MEAKNYNWTTKFFTADNLMVHTFGIWLEVATNVETGAMCVMRGGDVIERRNVADMLVSDYERFLVSIAEQAEKLNKFTKA